MDSMRGDFSGHGDLAGDAGYDAHEDETGREAPPAAIGSDERRMQVRAYNFWAGLLGDRHFPSIEELEPELLPDFGPHSVLLDFTAGMENPAIQYLGAKLAEECGADGPIKSLDDVPGRSLLSRITDHYMQILANQAPIGFEAEFVNQRGATVLYRGILLPFSSDDDTIDFIYGVINWKELADQETTDALLLEINQALEPRAEMPRNDGPMTEWADGPADTVNVLDLAVPIAEGDAFELPEPDFALELGSEFAEQIDDADMSLADWLASARESASAALGSEDRSRQALYAAIGRAWDFALAAADSPEDFAELLADSGMTAQDRAPMTPVVKLVFGADYDKTRLTEYASALGHAQRIGISRGAFASYLGEADGGLKGIVNAERRLRRDSAASPRAERTAPRDSLARKLRKLGHSPIAEVSPEGSEFTLLVARRLPDGQVVLLGEVGSDVALLERAARSLIA